MSADHSETALIGRARAGDASAMERLLHGRRRRVLAFLEQNMPGELRDSLDPGDLLQDTWVEAFRRIGQLVSADGAALDAWLFAIARTRIADALRSHRALKRGGRMRRLGLAVPPAGVGAAAAARDDDSQILDLLDELAALRRSPSQSAAAREAVLLLERSIARLPDDYRTAIRLRHVEGLGVKEAADRMSRTEGSFHMLCARGLKALRREMGSASDYI